MIPTTARPLRRVERVMGTAIGFDVREPIDEEVVDRAFEFLRWVDRTFSVHRPDSEVSRIGRGELSGDDACPQVREVLVRCCELREATDGWFDHEGGARRGRPLDPSGYVKGWSIDRSAERLGFEGAHSFCINAGGDVVARGRPDGVDPWRVGIRDPQRPAEVPRIIGVADAAVATSGSYERGEHIWSPGKAPRGSILSATVVGPELATADALATAVFASGDARPGWWHRFPDYRLIVVG